MLCPRCQHGYLSPLGAWAFPALGQPKPTEQVVSQCPICGKYVHSVAALVCQKPSPK